MELVYLWVEKYKNIENQGFNFSPRFECEFFPEYDENQKLKDNCKLEIKPKEYTSIFPDNINVTAIVGENGSGKSSIGGYFITKNFISSHGNDKCLLIMCNTNKLYIYNDTSIKIINKSQLSESQCADYYSDIVTTILNDKKSIDCTKLNNELLKEEFLFLQEKGFTGKTNEEILNNLGFYNDKKEKFNLARYIFSVLSEFSSRDNNLTGNSYRTIRPLERKDINNFEKLIGDKKLLEYIIEIIGFSHKVISKNSKIYFKNNDTDNFLFGNLSFGEKYMIHLLSSLYNRIKNNKQAIFFLDEVTLSVHPNLEKKFLSLLMKIVNKVSQEIKEKVNIHFIVTSHSPFILSDLPKENVIFLKKDENGNCKNVTKETNIETFGANIHTLLSHGFFMSDGLMGEFAKGKINDVYNFLIGEQSKVKTKQEAQNIINIVGEPLIKKQLQKLFDDRFDRNNLTLDKEIELLEKKLEALRKLKK